MIILLQGVKVKLLHYTASKVKLQGMKNSQGVLTQQWQYGLGGQMVMFFWGKPTMRLVYLKFEKHPSPKFHIIES